MSVLDSVLQYKARKEAQEAQAAQAIPQAVQAFITGRQEAQNNQLKMLSVQAELAGKGLKLTPQGIMRDESLTSPLEQLVSQSKAAEAAKTMGNRPLWESLTGQVSQQVPQQPQATGVQGQQLAQSSSLIDQMQAPEVDPFTGKPTTRGIQQEASNKITEQKLAQEAKSQVPTAKMREDLQSAESQLQMLTDLKEEAKKTPSGYAGIGSSIASFFTRGGNIPGTGKAVENVKVYNDKKPAIAVSIYRAATGDTRLSDADAKSRALPLLWDTSEAKNIQERKFNDLEKIFKARINLIKKGKYTQNSEGDFITSFEDVLSESKTMDDSSGSKTIQVGRFTVEVS